MSSPRWLARVLYALRGKRRVRLHCVAPVEGTNGHEFTCEGLELGRWAGHYVLMLPRVEGQDGVSEQLVGLLEVPAEHVVFRQVLR